MLKILLIVALGIPYTFCKQIAGDYVRTDGAKCIPLSECKEIESKLEDYSDTIVIQNLLCGYFHEPLVWCERNCTTPNGNAGRAISLDDCPHLKANKDSIKKDKRDFLLESRINDTDTVCCNLNEDNYHTVEPVPEVPGSFSPTCTTPNGDVSTCTSVAQCKAYEKVAEDTDESFRYINDSYCGYWKTPLICCGDKHYYSEQYQKKLPNAANAECGLWDTQLHPDVPPWLAIIKVKNNLNCVGALINEQYIISTAACNADRQNIDIKLGKCINFVNETDCNLEIDDLLVFPLHRYRHAQDTGIVLLRLKNPINLEKFVPICLPDEILTINIDIIIMRLERQTTKWVTTQEPYETGDNSECHNELQNALERIICIQDNHICSDIKSPLLQNIVLRSSEVEQWFLEGLLDTIDCYGQNSDLFHAISVYKFLSWIKSNIK